jgi:hypothetical protein
MGVHDQYGKKLLQRLLGKRFISSGYEVRVFYESGVVATIDGVIDRSCAVEIESRTDKQIRGAILDLLNHHLRKKLLVIIPHNMTRPEAILAHCRSILSSVKTSEDDAKVVLLKGTGTNPQLDADLATLRKALKDIGCL